MSDSRGLFFRRRLLEWYRPERRPLPWKGETDPYLIWLSEIILQQTRVEQGRPYYERFRVTYPDVKDLAEAPEDELMKLWEGLGYYSRARHLHRAARQIVADHGGRFPTTYAAIRALPGVGDYTAAAIASFAFGLPHAVVDGNVFRVLARFDGIDTPTDGTASRKQFAALAHQRLDPEQPALYNQAIMDFGALVCTPRNPDCAHCPLSAECRAFQQGRVDQLPVKAKKLARRTRYFHYLVVNQAENVWLHRRDDQDIWRQLYQFPLLELTTAEPSEEDFLSHPVLRDWLAGGRPKLLSVSPPLSQELTHQRIIARFWELELDQATLPPADFVSVERKNLRKFAFPKIIDWYLRDNSLYLKLV